MNMTPILRNVMAVIAGFLVGSVVNMAIVTVGPIIDSATSGR